MDTHFKLLRAHEEIDRLNVEIRRVATYVRDEDQYLRMHEERLRLSDPHLGHQIAIHRMVRGRFQTFHVRHLAAIAKLEGFTGTLIPGESTDTIPGASGLPTVSTDPSYEQAHSTTTTVSPPDSPIIISDEEQQELEEEEAEEEAEVEASSNAIDILVIALDKSTLHE
jgi:hypothetical protein